MARNKFGCICDVCGHTGENNMFYRLAIPCYGQEINNSVQHDDYCFFCYEKLKKAIAKHYKMEWAMDENDSCGES